VRLVDADVDANNNQAPTADFAVSVAGDTITLTNNSFDPESATLTYNWEFGDFETQTSVNPVHIYSNPGQYVIKLTVSDGYTSKQINKLVDVSF